MNVSVLICSRGRPDSFLKTCGSLFFNAKDPDNVEVICRIDYSDPEFFTYVGVAAGNIHVIGGPRFSGYASYPLFMDECAIASKGKILMLFGDDMQMQTQNWDKILCEIQKDIWVASANMSGRKGTPGLDYRFSCVAIPRKLYDICGCFGLGGNTSVDRCWEAVAKELDCEVKAPISIFHNDNWKDNPDKTSKEGRIPFCGDFNDHWKGRLAEIDAVGRKYAEMIRCKEARAW